MMEPVYISPISSCPECVSNSYLSVAALIPAPSVLFFCECGILEAVMWGGLHEQNRNIDGNLFQ